MLRGRKESITRFESDFWGRFPELAMDDKEDEHNTIIGILRDVAISYFKKLEDK